MHEIHDALPNNVLKDSAGELYFIDTFVINKKRKELFEEYNSSFNKNNSNMNHKEFTFEELVSPNVLRALQTNIWAKQAVEDYNNFIKQIQNGKYYFKRRVGERPTQTRRIDTIHAAASILLRGDASSAKKERRNPKEQYEIDAREGKKQEDGYPLITLLNFFLRIRIKYKHLYLIILI
jgi:hypothetical protein